MTPGQQQDPRPLAGRRALVTGGASGIGRAIATGFAEAGAQVTVLDRDPAAKAVADQIGGLAVVTDLSDLDAIADLDLDVDIVVNNAGIQHVAPLESFPPEKFSFILRVMLEAPFRIIRGAVAHMYEGGWGWVINLSSVHGLRASAYKSAYVSAMHGLEGLECRGAGRGRARRHVELHQPRLCAHSPVGGPDRAPGAHPRHLPG